MPAAKKRRKGPRRVIRSVSYYRPKYARRDHFAATLTLKCGHSVTRKAANVGAFAHCIYCAREHDDG